MAKKRRSYQINSGDYNIAGGGGGASGNIRFMQKATTAVAAGGTGVLYNPGSKQVPNPLKLTIEAGLAVSSATQTNSLVYFEHAFEAPQAQVGIVDTADELPTGYSNTLPSGLSISTNADSGGDTSFGYVQFGGATISSGATVGTYKFRYYVDQGGWTRQYIDYEVEVYPQGTTPVQQDSNILTTLIIRNQSAQQALTGTITGSQIVGMTLKDVTGVPTGYELKLNEANGVVYVENTPNTSHSSTTHSFTVEVDIGQYGKVDYVYSGSISYGDPYGARYFGPANASLNFSSGQDYSGSQSTTDSACNPDKASGALRRVYNVAEDTSPYLHNDGYGCHPVGNQGASWTTQNGYNTNNGYYKNGIMGYNAQNSNWWCSGSNFQSVKFRWTVPAGVTSICAVAVGGGGGGAYNWAQHGGGSGGLCWMNGISVTPGQVWYVYVGLGRESESSHSSYGAGPSMLVHPNGTTVLFAEMGGYSGYQNANANGQRSYNGHTPNGLNIWEKGNSYGNNDSRDSGGWGVASSYGSSVNGFHYGGGAGFYANSSRVGIGAPGYRGNQQANGNSTQGYYGGGGQGYEYSSTYGQGGGGGVGLDGQGWRGTHGTNHIPRNNTNAGSGFGGSGGSWTSYNNSSANFYGGGGGGSGGTRGAWGENQFTGREENSNGHRVRVGGTHGGGGGGSGTSYGGGNGAPGGVRIIWGIGADGTPRSFPYTYCSEKPSMKYNGES